MRRTKASIRLYEPSEAGGTYVAAAFSPDGQVLASRPFSTQAEAEAFLQAFMQEKAGEYGLVHEGSAPEKSVPVDEGLQERRAEVIKSAKDETKRRRLAIHGKKIE